MLSDEILESLEQLDVLEAAKLTPTTRAGWQRVRTGDTGQDGERSLGWLKEDLARVEAERSEAESLVPDAARTDYQRLIAARGEDAIAPIEDQTCGGCYQMLTTQVMNQIALSRLCAVHPAARFCIDVRLPSCR